MQWNKALLGCLSLGLVLLSGEGSAQAWTEAEQISDGASMVNPMPSNLTIDQNSNAISGWLQGTLGVDNTLYSSSLPAGAPLWRKSEVLYTGTAPEFASFPLLFTNDSDKVIALWANFHENEGVYDQTTLLSAFKESLGSAWSTPIVSSSLAGFPNGGGAAVDEFGNRLGVLALGPDNQTHTPPFTITLMGLASEATSWATPIELGIDNSTVSPPAIFVAAAEGLGLVGWREASPFGFNTARYDFSSGTLQKLSDFPFPAGTTDIGFVRGAMAPNGNAVIVLGLQNGEGGNYVLYSSFLPAQSTIWTYPEMISTPINNTAFNFLSIGTDNDANSVIVWGEHTASETVFIRAGTLTFGGSIENVINLTNPSLVATVNDFSGVHVDIDEMGNAVAIWQLISEGAPTVQVASLPSAGEWSIPQTLSTRGGFPRVALSNQGTAIAVWLDSVTSFLYGSKNNRLFPLNPPSGFAGYFSQAPGNDYYLNMHWSPSLSNNILSYQIFRDNELVASIPGTGPFTHSLFFDCKLLYGVYTLVAVGSNGNKSLPVSFTLTE